MEEREMRGEEKNYRQSSSIPWRPAHADPQCRRWRNALDTTEEGYLQPLEGAACAVQRV